MSKTKCLYDVIVIGGGPIGLSSAYQCAVKRGKKIAVIEKFKFGHQHGSSAGFSRQWRTCYAQFNLSALAAMTSPLWDQLMHELKDNTLLSRTGVLWVGNGGRTTSEGNIEDAEKNLKSLALPYTSLKGKDEIKEKFPFIAAAVEDVKNPVGLYVRDGGTINVPALIKAFVSALRACPTAVLMEETSVTNIDYSQPEEIRVTTSDEKQLLAKKIILTPGAYVNLVLATLKPTFPSVVNYIIYLWCSTYFETTCEEKSSLWPSWYYFGEPKPAADSDGSVDHSIYYGFPSIASHLPDKARVAPAFTSRKEFDFDLYPPDTSKRPVDKDAVRYTCSFVKKSMPDLKSTPTQLSTCIAGFAEMVDEDIDSGAGFVLDFVPGTGNRIILATGGWCMKFVPMFGLILSDLAIDGMTNFVYRAYIEPMNINRGILKPKKVGEEIRLVKHTTKQ